MNHCTKEQLIAFERRIAGLWEAGELPYLIHLSGGNEEPLIEIFREVQPGDWVFSSHRNHYHYLLSGGSPERLETLIREGQSMFVYEQWRGGTPGAPNVLRSSPMTCEVNFFSSSVLAGTCAIAAGVAYQFKVQGSRFKVWCFIGDGAEDEGHFYEAARFCDGFNLPCTFIIEDNDRSVDTYKGSRLGNYRPGLEVFNHHIRRYYYGPTYPHAGNGCKHQIQFKERNVHA